MNRMVDRRAVLRAAAAVCASLVIPTARACEFTSGTLRVTHPWTRATAPGAITAALCMKFDEVNETDRLIGVQTPIATGAELGGLGAGALDLLVPAGGETLLSEQGTYVLLTGLKHPLLVARSYPLALAFEKGGVVLATLNVDYSAELTPFATRRFF